MIGVSIAMKSFRTTILHKEIGAGPHGASLEFDFSIGHALVLIPFFFNNKQKMYGGICMSPPHTLQNSYISIYFGHKTLFSPNLMIIIMGTFRNTSNYMK